MTMISYSNYSHLSSISSMAITLTVKLTNAKLTNVTLTNATLTNAIMANSTSDWRSLKMDHFTTTPLNLRMDYYSWIMVISTAYSNSFYSV